MATIDEIKQQAAAVKNATQVGENTAERVGGALSGLADIAKQQYVELNKKFDKQSVAQESGYDENSVMSQKATTTKLAELKKNISDISKEVIDTEEEEIIIEDNSGNQAVKINSTGADFKNLKSDGVKVSKVGDSYTKSESDAIYVTDISGKADKTDVEALQDKTSEISKETIETDDDSISIEDNNGNEMLHLNKNGLNAKNIRSNGETVLTEKNISDFAPKDEFDNKTKAIDVENTDNVEDAIDLVNNKGKVVTTVSVGEEEGGKEELEILSDDNTQFVKLSKDGVFANGFYLNNGKPIDNQFRVISTTKQLIDSMEKGGNYFIKAGTYDIFAELGESYFDNFKPEDIGPIMNDGVYIFSPNAKVKCINTSAQINAINGMSPINTEGHNITIIGLNIEAQNVKYCIHDELGGDLEPYYHKFLNCNFKQVNCIECIGGGLGYSGNIDIDSCFFEGDEQRQQASGQSSKWVHYECSYHNDYRAGARSQISIRNCYFTLGTFRGGAYGDSTEVTRVIVANNRFTEEPYKTLESDIYQNDNVEIYKINNKIE